MSFGWSDELKEFNRSDYSDEEWQAIQEEIIDEETMDDCRMTWVKNKPISHLEMFAILSAEYPEQVGVLLKNAESSPNLDDFCQERLSLMQIIYKQNQGLNPGNSREMTLTLETQTTQINLSRFENVDVLLTDVGISKQTETQFGEN
jgi:hypothetical protein